MKGPLRKSGQSADEKPKEKEKQEVKLVFSYFGFKVNVKPYRIAVIAENQQVFHVVISHRRSRRQQSSSYLERQKKMA